MVTKQISWGLPVHDKYSEIIICINMKQFNINHNGGMDGEGDGTFLDEQIDIIDKRKDISYV